MERMQLATLINWAQEEECRAGMRQQFIRDVESRRGGVCVFENHDCFLASMPFSLPYWRCSIRISTVSISFHKFDEIVVAVFHSYQFCINIIFQEKQHNANDRQSFVVNICAYNRQWLQSYITAGF